LPVIARCEYFSEDQRKKLKYTPVLLVHQTEQDPVAHRLSGGQLKYAMPSAEIFACEVLVKYTTSETIDTYADEHTVDITGTIDTACHTL
jgi:hypothetical protein